MLFAIVSALFLQSGDLDRWVLQAAQSVHASWLDVAGSAIGVLGQGEVTIGIALGIAAARFRRYPRDALIPLFIFATLAVEVILKTLVTHPPPPDELSRTVQVLPFIHVPFANSFPSGHVARAAFLLRIGRGVPTWAFVVGVALMMASRIYLGEHWLSDTVGGLVLGLGAANIARRLT